MRRKIKTPADAPVMVRDSAVRPFLVQALPLRPRQASHERRATVAAEAEQANARVDRPLRILRDRRVAVPPAVSGR